MNRSAYIALALGTLAVFMAWYPLVNLVVLVLAPATWWLARRSGPGVAAEAAEVLAWVSAGLFAATNLFALITY
jgi:hypothetical protein